MLSARAPNILLDHRPDFNARAFASKTPGRHGAQNTAAGLKSALRKENALVPKTTLARSKATLSLVDGSIEPKRLFKELSGKVTTAGGGGKGLSDVTNKTPAPTRRQPLGFKTPLPGTSKPLKLAPLLSASAESSYLAPEEAPSPPRAEPPPSALRPSSSRRTSRIIRSGSKSFETPLPSTRKHWDVSEGDISVKSVEALSEVEIREEVNEDEEDEIEYMPPTAWIEPYEIPFPMPDYKDLCAKVMEISKIPVFGDPNEDFFDDSYLETWVVPECGPEELRVPLRPLEEEDFFGPPLEAPKPAASRPTTAASRLAKSPASRAVSATTTTRPGTSVPRSQASSALSRPASKPVTTKAAAAARPLAATARTPLRPVTRTRQPATTTKSAIPSRLAPSKPLPKVEPRSAAKPSDTLEVFLSPPEFTELDTDFRFEV